jgi:hypothetical protein
LGAKGTNAGAAVSLQLKDVVGDGGGDVVELLLPPVSGSDPQPADHRVPLPFAAPYSGKLLIVWDGLPSHRSRATWEFIREQRGRLWVEFLPGYAPDLNPVEYLWSHWKQHELPNFCPQNFGQLSHYARRALRRMRKRPTLLIAFWRQVELFPL